MTNYIQIIIDVIIGVILLLFIFLSILLYKIGNKRSRKLKLEKMIKKTKKNRIAKSESTLNRIQIIAKNNKKFESLYIRLGETFDLMSEKTNKNLKDIAHLLLNNKDLKNKQFASSIQKIENNITEINDLEIKFNSNAMKVTQQDEFTRSEQAFYNRHLRTATNIYREKRILLEKISSKIDNVLDNIVIIGSNFNDAIVRADAFETNKILKEYAKSVIHFCEVINKGPKFQIYIYETLPKLALKLEKKYHNQKKQFKLKFNNMNFQKIIADISNQYLKIKKDFLNLNIFELETTIKEIIKKIKVAESNIEKEVESYSAFKINYPKSLKEMHDSLKEFLKVKNQFSELRKEGDFISNELMDKYKLAFRESKEVDKSALEFKNIDKNDEISYTTKLMQMKKVIIKLKNFNEQVSEVKEGIHEIKVNKFKLKNKFTRTKDALENLLSQAKSTSIEITDEAVAVISEIKKENNKIIKIVTGQTISKKEEEVLNVYINKMIGAYKIIAGTMKLSEIVRNLTKKFAANRAANKNLNYQLTLAEREYLEGKYASSLNAIIVFLEGE